MKPYAEQNHVSAHHRAQPARPAHLTSSEPASIPPDSFEAFWHPPRIPHNGDDPADVSGLRADYTLLLDVLSPQQTRLYRATAALEHATGYRAGELEGLNGWHVLLHAQDRMFVEQQLARLIRRDQDQVVCEFRMVTRTGTVRWLRSHMHLAPMPATSPVGGSRNRVLVTARDMTAQKQVEQSLRLSEEHFRLAFEHAPLAMMLVNTDGQILRVNTALGALLAQAPAALLNHSLADLVAAPDRWQVQALQTQLYQQHTPVVVQELRLHVGAAQTDQDVLWVRLNASVLHDLQGNVLGELYMLENLSNDKVYQQEIAQLTTTDRLTGLANRERLITLGEAAVQTAHAAGQQTALLIIDLDRFKMINDTMGHATGDTLLKHVTGRLRDCTPAEGTLARLGGDEFALLLPSTNEAHSRHMAQQVLDTLHQPFVIDDHLLYLTASVGVALSTPEQRLFAELLTRADVAMYHAKTTGSRMCLYDAAFHTHRIAQLQIETELRLSLATNEFMLHYQPIVETCNGNLIGVEALVRWQHPTRGLLMPGEFLPQVEQANLQGELDLLVLRQALQQAAIWNAAGQSTVIAVNISPPSLHDPTLPAQIQAMLTAANVAAHQIIIEVTEHTTLSDMAPVQQVLDDLKAMGCKLALDDFGNGAASLTNLHHMKGIDILKIDRAFVAGLGHETRNESVMQALLTLGEALGVRVVVEGIEDPAQLDWLRTTHCSLVQGFLLGRPLPAEALFA